MPPSRPPIIRRFFFPSAPHPSSIRPPPWPAGPFEQSKRSLKSIPTRLPSPDRRPIFSGGQPEKYCPPYCRRCGGVHGPLQKKSQGGSPNGLVRFFPPITET